MAEINRPDPIQSHLAQLRREVDNRAAQLGALRAQQTDLNRRAEALRRESADLLVLIEKLEA